MKNTYEGTLTDEELAEASLQDDLGLDYSEFIELVNRLEQNKGCFIEQPVLDLFGVSTSISVKFFKSLCNNNISDRKIYYS